MTRFENHMMVSDKFKVLISGNKAEQVWDLLGGYKIWETRTVKLLGISIDVFKVYNNLSETSFSDLFISQETYMEEQVENLNT